MFVRKTSKPYKVCQDKTQELRDKWVPSILARLKNSYPDKIAIGKYTFYAVNQNKGRCSYGRKLILIPTWVWRNEKELIWYVAHEIAHIFAYAANHGSEFMEQLKRICPPDVIHYELNYKPRNASAAGISREFSYSMGDDVFVLLNHGEDWVKGIIEKHDGYCGGYLCWLVLLDNNEIRSIQEQYIRTVY